LKIVNFLISTCTQPNSFYTHLPACEDGKECSETSAYKFQTSGNHPKQSMTKIVNLFLNFLISI